MTAQLKGRTALVAGASSGVGAAIALELARQGAGVALVARRPAELDAAREQVAAEGVPSAAVVADLAQEGGAQTAHAEAERTLGPIDILVNCAAAVQTAPVHEVRPKHWDLQMQLNVTVPFQLTQLTLPGMRERGWGRIVNISSAVSLERIAGTAPYAVTKQALNTLTELTDLENRGHGVRALALCLGWVGSRLSPDLTEYGVTPDDLLTADHVATTVGQLVTMDPRISLGPVLRMEPTSPRAGTRASVERHVRDTATRSTRPTEAAP
ncbi:SDR family NAD(P)-dependent oxidoreductase [Streptomyces lonarensis]|uniref:SDR family oxidoreductase n=1 Tax=Streptomyces lonarensis TaxID=700599 RepID=A0A7X6HXR7_9ACTN|nr:SDR family oxidoreductase [Streptomyces lonarensis]NJQ04846.1 SDR family oxidoreductase [Streptomyces lonarensis]